MKELKSLSDIFAHEDSEEELYTSDQRKRWWRAKKGYYTKKEGLFSFVHLIKAWEEIVGKVLASNTSPLKIKNKTLYISTKHSVFANELSFLIPKILEKVHESFPELKEQVTKVKFAHSNLSTKSSPAKKISTNKPKKPKLHPYSPEYLERKVRAQNLLHDLEDDEIREAITRFLLDE